MLAAGESLSITGGHGDVTGLPDHVHVDSGNLVDSPEEGVRKVRDWNKRGVDLIKLHATGGVMSNHDDPGAPSFSPAEFKAIVEEARRRGMDTIVLCGISTEYGVESTARFAYEYGFQQVFAEDAMASASAESHNAAVQFIFRRMGRVRSTDEILAAIG